MNIPPEHIARAKREHVKTILDEVLLRATS
jgi:hypothetical protein